VKYLGQIQTLCLTKDAFLVSFSVTALFTYSHQPVYEGFPYFFTSYQHLIIFDFYIIVTLVGIKLIFHYGFNLHFSLMINHVYYISKCLSAISVSSLKKKSIETLPMFWIIWTDQLVNRHLLKSLNTPIMSPKNLHF
jgi:hypothetical protein